MNTTNTPRKMPAYQEITADELSVGDIYAHSSGDKLIISLEFAQDGYVSIHWEGGLTMCEGNDAVCILVK